MICKRWFREYKIEFSLFIVALILSLLPIFVSVVKTPRDFIPTLNNQFYDMRDVFVYTAGVRLGLDGNFLYKYKFYPAKAENQVLIYPALTITGLILKPLSVLIPKFYLAIGGYLLLKIIGSVLLFLAALHFFKSFNFSKRESIITTAFLLFSGGSVSIDFPGLFPEAALTIASFSLDLSFTLLAVSFTKRIVEHFNKINCLWLAAAILGVVVTHPYSLLPVLCIVIGTTTILLAKKTIKIQTSAGIFATFIPALSYCVYLYYNYYQLDALGWVKMFDGVAQFMKTPPVIVIVIYLGLQGTLVAWYILKNIRITKFSQLIMFVWLGSAFITAYLPSNTQKAQIKSLGLVLVVMAGAAFANIISSKLTKINWKILSPILLIFLGGYFINTTFPIYRILNQKTPDKISYISKNRLMALDWLDKHENNKSRTVLSTEKEMGSYVPLITNLTTLNSYALFESAEIIKDNSKVIPDYVIEISGGNIIKSTEYGAVYQNPEVTIYENTKI